MGEMAAFVEVAQSLSFSKAARNLKQTPSGISKLITRLESRLGVTLLLRSTRNLRLTAEGELYFEKSLEILQAIRETENMLAMGYAIKPKGKLKISASVGFGETFITPILPKFLKMYPEVEVDLWLTDVQVDLLGEKTDIAIRSGKLKDSNLKSRKLLECKRSIVASPSYIKQWGKPKNPRDLLKHNCLRFNFLNKPEEWNFQDKKTKEFFSIPVQGSFFGNSGSLLKQMVLNSAGIARIGNFHVKKEIKNGSLVTLLDSYNEFDTESIYVLFVPQEHMALRIRVFIDFLIQNISNENLG